MCANLHTDRPTIDKPLEKWEIHDKESLKAWVRRFLWHMDGPETGGPEEMPDDPEGIILDNIIKTLVPEEGVCKIVPTQLLDPSYYFQIDGNH